MAQLVKNLPVMQETWVRPLGWEDPLEKGKATHSSILGWRIHKELDTTEQLSLSLLLNEFHKGFGATHKVITQINLKKKHEVWQKGNRSRKVSDVKQIEVGVQSIRQGLHTSSDPCPDRVSELLCHQLSDISEEESQDPRGLKINNKIERAIAREMHKTTPDTKIKEGSFP